MQRQLNGHLLGESIDVGTPLNEELGCSRMLAERDA
jgi:hypothetical protein